MLFKVKSQKVETKYDFKFNLINMPNFCSFDLCPQGFVIDLYSVIFYVSSAFFFNRYSKSIGKYCSGNTGKE